MCRVHSDGSFIAKSMQGVDERQPLGAIFWRFLRFGFLAWGGPVAQITMIKRERVEDERWVEPSRFKRACRRARVSIRRRGSISARLT